MGAEERPIAVTNRKYMKLGRKPPLPVEKSRRLAFAAAFGTQLPAPSDSRDWTNGDTSRPIWANDVTGDCTCVTIANDLIGVLRSAYGSDLKITTEDVVRLYENFGYVPGNEATDQGAVFEDVTNYVLKHGFLGHHMIGSVGVDPKNVANIKRAIDWFGCANFGIELPTAWQNAKDWTLDAYVETSPEWQIGSWGGHEVCAEQYDANGVYVWSWGEKIFFSYDAIAKYCDEIDAPIWASWIKGGLAPNHLSLDTLEAYSADIRAA
jgi:hypothetical protein